MDPVHFIIYDPVTGAIIGAGYAPPQDIAYEHHLIVDEQIAYNTALYRMNADRTGVELIPDYFVTYAEPGGNLTGRYESPSGTGPTQPNSIQVWRDVYDTWELYRATDDRTGVRLILNDAQILANYKPQIRNRMEANARAAGFGSLAEAIRWKDRVGSVYEQHAQDWNDYEVAVWAYCTMDRIRPEPAYSVFLAQMDAAVPPPAAIPYPWL